MAIVSEPAASYLSDPSIDQSIDTDDPTVLDGDPAPKEELLSANWGVVGWLVLLHLGALSAPLLFTWEAVALMFAMHWFTGGIGICLGFHRMLTHTSFKTFRPIRYAIAVIGGLAGEGSAIDWVASHRKHHALSDQEGDPHSPRDGAIWSHMLWLSHSIYGRNQDTFTHRWAPDLAKDPMMVRIGRWAISAHFVVGVVLFAAGYLWGGAYMGWSFMLWGVFARLVFVLHSTWLVNSASHMWGYTNYETPDDSRNNWFVALCTYGEGWHNNHHAYPRMANHGHKWWEFDMTFWTIRMLQKIGLAWDVVDYKQRTQRP
jgi:stearoyl-CoA desaturase (delta-9 desaturase)